MSLLPFFNKYPYTNFEQLNLDYILTETAKFSKRVEVLEEKVEDHETRLTTAEADIDALEDRATELEGRVTIVEGDIVNIKSDITDLEGRVTTNEGEIAGLKTRLTGDEALISALQTETSGQGVKIATLENQMQTAQSDIITLQSESQSHTNDITALDSRVTTLESESAVIANPGGTGANLNTISIDDVTYVIPSGGGSGGGSSVTPNPTGTATGTLEKVDIDGIIYEMPVSTTEVTQITNNITNIQNDITEVESDISDLIDQLSDDINKRLYWEGSGNNYEGLNDNTVQDIPRSGLTITEPGVYLFILRGDFDTRNFGSSPRDIGMYLRNYTSDPTAPDPAANVGLAKGHINGNESAMITQAYNLNLSTIAIVDNQMINDGWNNFKLSFRVYSTAAAKNVDVAIYANCIKLNSFS